MNLAIVIPYFKITFFEDTLKSLANQTNKNFTVYIGDDASPDDPSSLLKKYKDKFKYKYFRFNKNLGGVSLVQQWNRCIEKVDLEEWVMILGDDDYLGDKVIESWYNNFKIFENKSSVVRFSSCKIDGIGKQTSDFFYSEETQDSIDFLFNHKRSSLSEYIFKKNKILKIGFKDFPLAWCTDTLAVFEFSLHNQIYTINKAVVYVRITNLSISGKTINNKLKYIASENFSKYVILNYYFYFDKNQKQLLLLGYENAMKRNKTIKIVDWSFLLKKHLKNLNMLQISKFAFRFFKYYLK